MNKLLSAYFEKSLAHKYEHDCGSYPYEHADKLSTIVKEYDCKKMLEVGTGIGYTSAYITVENSDLNVDTIDQDQSHLDLAEGEWKLLRVRERITPLFGKAEDVLPTIHDVYDCIFFDGYVPQKKFLPHFERLLKKDGILVTANLFLRDEKGGNYLKELQVKEKWDTTLFSDTAVSIKL